MGRTALARMLDCGIRCVGPRKAVGLLNLARAYPEMDEAHRREILREVYRHITLTAAEYLCLVNHPRSFFDWVRRSRGNRCLGSFGRTERAQ
jgi:KDO2-lipid IV(A) lauroyltransferase